MEEMIFYSPYVVVEPIWQLFTIEYSFVWMIILLQEQKLISNFYRSNKQKTQISFKDNFLLTKNKQ